MTRAPPRVADAIGCRAAARNGIVARSFPVATPESSTRPSLAPFAEASPPSEPIVALDASQ